MFSKPPMLILTYCKRNKTDKFVLKRKFYIHKMSTMNLTWQILYLVIEKRSTIFTTHYHQRRYGGGGGNRAPPTLLGRLLRYVRIRRLRGGGKGSRRKVKQNNKSSDIHRRFLIKCNRLNKFMINGL